MVVSRSSLDGPIRLAILEADIPTPGIIAKHQSYGGVITHLFERACASLEPPQPLESLLDISAYNIVDDPASYPKLESIDALLISGSRYSAFDNDEWIIRLVQYTKRALEDGRVRVVGICFGHQLIGRAMGANVGRNRRGWEISVRECELTEEGKKVFGMKTLVWYLQHLFPCHFALAYLGLISGS
jgi:GMP synthase-like glutamine amidotransferase